MSNEEYAKIVSKNLKRILYDCGRTQADLARDLKIAKTTISGWMNGNRTPRMETVDRLAHYFNVSRADILDDKNGYYEKAIRKQDERQEYFVDKEAQEFAEFLHENPDYKVLMDSVMKIKPDDISFIKEMIDRANR